MSGNKKALVTLAIGEKYVQFWERFCKPTWEPYAEKHGYDIVVIKNWIDTSEGAQARTPHWQKLLILEAPETQGYDDIVWVDSDIAMNYVTAPCIVEANSCDKVGVVRYSEAYNAEMIDGGFARTLQTNMNPLIADAGNISFADRYERAGLVGDVNDMINTGVMVLKPHHREALRHVYETAVENPFSAKENIPLSYHLLKNDLVNGIDGRFNKIFDLEVLHNYPYLLVRGTEIEMRMLFYIVNTVFLNSFFLHFIEGGTRGYMQMVLPGATYPAVYGHIQANAPKQIYTVGKQFLEL